LTSNKLIVRICYEIVGSTAITKLKAFSFLAFIIPNSEALRLEIVFAILGFKLFNNRLSSADNKPSVVSVAGGGATAFLDILSLILYITPFNLILESSCVTTGSSSSSLFVPVLV